MFMIATFGKRAAGCAAIALIAGCSGGTSATFRDADARVIDGYTVKWSDASAIVGQGPSGLKTLMFIVAPGQNGQPPADLEQRQRLAKAALDSGARCRWERFDPALNQRLTYANGGADFTLYALARC
ncbi:MAG: hypothetical protein U1E69_16460 [Tabrizicola sp.]|uniref:hypothetical protein n=1 Tax=Tabrizicola sp. TaxID=2005166 RepID=UPI002ABBCE1A|nr:hypothetical protein [Tabrizicola sp.]MDZ4088382.1 hypothetical protein [Tabrizicola sp.]